jgi:hypothetical protein
MDHAYITDRGLVSLYVAGKLSADERLSFEEHFVDCQQCLDEIELTDDFRDALKRVTKEDAARGAAPESGWSAWAALGFWQQPKLLAFAGLVVVFALAAVFFAGTRYRRSELAEARRASDEWQRRYADERKAREESSSKAADRSPLVADMQAAPLFFLTVTRGSDEGAAPANHIAVPQASPWIVLSLEFEKDPAFRSYRAQLSDAQGRVLWSAEQIPPPSDALAISLPSRLLSPGRYAVTLDGQTAAGRFVSAAHFRFKAIPQK